MSQTNHITIKNSKAAISEKARVILALIIGAVVTAKAISNTEEQANILRAAQDQIFAFIGMKAVANQIDLHS